MPRSGLTEAGVTGGLVDGAAAGTSLSLPYCTYLLPVLLDAVASTEDASLYQPQLNELTVFAETWHAASLARLSDADIANAWRLADYLMLDAACVGCLEDVIVQRQARWGVANQFITPQSVTVSNRVASITELLDDHPPSLRPVARGVAVLHDRNEIPTAALWGHWDLLRRAQASGLAWHDIAPSAAAQGGQLRLLQRLRHARCSWNEMVIHHAISKGHGDLAIWAIEHGAPTFSGSDLLADAASFECFPVLRWAWSNGRLRLEDISKLRQRARNYGHNRTVAWLDELVAGAGTAAETVAA